MAIVDADFSVSGMDCASCSARVEQELAQTKGIVLFTVSLFSGKASIKYDSTLLSSQAILSSIRKLGFGADTMAGGGSAALYLTMSGGSEQSVKAVVDSLTATGGVTAVSTTALRDGFFSRSSTRTEVSTSYDPGRVGARALVALAHTAGSSGCEVEVQSGTRDPEEGSVRSMLYRLYAGGLCAIVSSILAYALPDLPRTIDLPLDAMGGGRGTGLVTPRVLLQAALATVSLGYVARPIAVSAYAAAVHSRMMTMDTLVIVSSGAAYAVSVGMMAASIAGTPRVEIAPPLFETCTILMALVMVGRTVEHAAKRSTAAALRKLAEIQRAPATLVQLEEEEKEKKGAPVADCCAAGSCGTGFDDRLPSLPTMRVLSCLLQLGDIVRVSPGERLPADGVCVHGPTAIDESALTGESVPTAKGVGDTLVGGTVNVEGVTYVRVTALPGAGAVARIISLIEHAAAQRPSVQLLADRVASYFTPAIFLAAIASFGMWYALAVRGVVDTRGAPPPIFALLFGLSLLVVSCPCAISLAVPVAVLVAVLMGTRFGALIKGGPCVEALTRVRHVVLDKTGTLTTGKARVTDCRLCVGDRVAVGAARAAGLSADVLPGCTLPLSPGQAAVIALLAEAERGSLHPLARAFVEHAEASISIKRAVAQGGTKGLTQSAAGKKGGGGGCSGGPASQAVTAPIPDPLSVVGTRTSVSGQGVRYILPNGAKLAVGRTAWVLEQAGVDEGCDEAADALEASAALEAQGCSTVAVAVAVEDVILAVVGAKDTVRQEAAAVLRALTDEGCTLWIASGDNAGSVQAVATTLGIPHVRALSSLRPEDKADLVRAIQAGRQAGMGDAAGIGREEGGERIGLLAKGKASSSSQCTTSVMMVGDGINDAVALTAADVGVALGAGTAVACDCADVVLARSDLTPLPALLRLAHATQSRIRWNFAWAFVYNALAMPLAGGALWSAAGVNIPPQLAGASELLSSVPVVLGSLLLMRFK